MGTIWGRESLALLTLLILGLSQFLVTASEHRANATDNAIYRWGPYRPNLYFGVRPQVPDTILMGMMWGQGQDKSTLINTLHDTCEQEDDGIDGFGWTAYDTKFGGSQTIHDSQGYVDIKTDFIKMDTGDSWGVQVSGSLRPDAPSSVKTAIIFHVAHEKTEHNSTTRSLQCTTSDTEARVAETTQIANITCDGKDPALRDFEIHVTGDTNNNLVEGPVVAAAQVPEDLIWKAKSVFVNNILTGVSGQEGYLNDKPGNGNMHFMQMVFEGPFTVTFTYQTKSTTPLSPDDIKESINSFQPAFSSNVDKVFPRAAPFDDDEHANFSRALLSNLLGGLGFFHGDTKVDYSNATEYLETDLNFWDKVAEAIKHAEITTTKPMSLLSHIPSRPVFPRGFLWDEGFHLLPVIEWDLDLAVSVLQSWLNLMDDDGWIGREQILGPEARSRVPEGFQVQYPHYANPPTLSLLFPILISKLNTTSTYTGHPSKYLSSTDDAPAMLGELYNLLSRHYQWFRRTQAGNFTSTYPRPKDAITGEGFRWRGRTPMHTFTSGLDDYPRANPPHPGELHVDALAWVGASSQALQQVASYLGEDDDATMYAEHLDAVRHNLDAIHWDPTESAYCDTTIGPEGNFERVCHLGYMSLYPLLLGLLEPDDPHLPFVLNLLSDPSRLWSPYGLRSLSATDPNYGKDDDYWRGAVWINLNVLAVLRLRDLGLRDGPEKTRALGLAAQLRLNVVGAVFESWRTTGLFWEQYSDATGEGRRSRAFTGWTACVILLLGLDDLAEVQDGSSGSGSGSTGTSAGGISVTASVSLVVSLGLIVAFRRRLMGFSGSVMEYFRGKGKGRIRLQDQGHEHVHEEAYEMLNFDDDDDDDNELDSQHSDS